MILCRLRRRAGLYLSVILLLVGVSLTARATQPVTRSEMESFVFLLIGGAACVLFAAVWTLLAYHLGRLERMFQSWKEDMASAVAMARESLRLHDEDEHAHGPASEHNHGPMYAQMDRIEAQGTETAELLHQLIRDHNRIQQEEGAICAALAEFRKRDPKDSPRPHRKGDSGTDYTALRGKGE